MAILNLTKITNPPLSSSRYVVKYVKIASHKIHDIIITLSAPLPRNLNINIIQKAIERLSLSRKFFVPTNLFPRCWNLFVVPRTSSFSKIPLVCRFRCSLIVDSIRLGVGKGSDASPRHVQTRRANCFDPCHYEYILANIHFSTAFLEHSWSQERERERENKRQGEGRGREGCAPRAQTRNSSEGKKRKEESTKEAKKASTRFRLFFSFLPFFLFFFSF